MSRWTALQSHQYNYNMLIKSCIDNLGLKGVCDTTRPYLLDTIGISLKKAALLADSSSITGKELFENSKKLAYDILKNDISFDGFKMIGIVASLNNTINRTSLINSYTIYEKEIKRECDLQSIYVQDVCIGIIGKADVVVKIISDDIYTYYNSTIEDEKATIFIDSSFDSESLTIRVEVTPITPSISISTDNDDLGFRYMANIQCSEDILLSKYCGYWMMALMYKTAAIILNNIHGNDRYNDMIAYGASDIKMRIAQLDSSLNVMPKELTPINGGGLYQQELSKIDRKMKAIIKESRCSCCFECSGVASEHIHIP